MKFFVPGACNDEEAERAYVSLAGMCERSVAPMEERIHSLSYTADGKTYRATVGEPREVTIDPESNGHGDSKEARKAGRVIYAIFAGPTFRIYESGTGSSEFPNPTDIETQDIKGEPEYFEIG